MGAWQHASPEAEKRLVELAHLFASCREAFFDIAQDEFHWTPTPGSLASLDLANTEEGPDGQWGEQPVRQMTMVVGNYLLVAAGHLGALATLHAGQEVLLSPPLLVRAVIENCARVIWVLAIDHPDSTRSRVTRAYLEEFLSAQEAKTAAGRMGDKTSETYKDAHKAYLELRDNVLPARFIGVTREHLGEGQLEDQHLPSVEACVTWMYEQTHKVGTGITARQGQGVYGFLCNMTHPTLYPVRQMTTWHEHDGHLESHLGLDLSFIEKLAGAAVIPFFNAVSLLLSYMGWTTKRWDEWEQVIDRTLPDTFSN
jgi:hypothetical protein